MIMKMEAAMLQPASQLNAIEKARFDPKRLFVFRSDSERVRLAPRKTATDMPLRLAMNCLPAAPTQTNSFLKVSLLLRENAHPKNHLHSLIYSGYGPGPGHAAIFQRDYWQTSARCLHGPIIAFPLLQGNNSLRSIFG
jgi:hypothetical protein